MAKQRSRLRRKTNVMPFPEISAPKLEIRKSAQYEILGVIYLLIAIIATLALTGLAGPLGNIIEGGLRYFFGVAVWLFPLLLASTGLILILFHKRYGITSAKILGIFLIVCGILGIIHLTGGTKPEGFYELAGYDRASELGGLIGFTVATMLYLPLKETAAQIVLVFIIVLGAILVFDFSIREIVNLTRKQIPDRILPDVEIKGQASKLNIVTPDGAKVKPAKTEPEPEEAEKPKAKTERDKGRVNVVTRKVSDKPLVDIDYGQKKYKEWQFPALNLLDTSTSSIIRDDKYLQEKAEQIRNKLEQFGIDVTMKDVHLGPTVMQYTLKPAEDVKLSKITALKNDLALALSAESLRIEAPIPGKPLVGIEVPNRKRAVVRLHEILVSEEFRKKKGNLKIPIGRAADGTPIVDDLTEMPHLLVAGQTGSGKSVAINTILVSLLYQNSPADLRLILVDPKRVELGIYNAIPHLLTPVIIEPEKTIAALRWAVSEMTRRYKLCAEHHTRNIGEYNQANPDDKLPYIVIVVDELADLMMVAGKEVEALICRIAQMARAIGIHLIIATQRPSVDVITGLIKANIPTRIAFTVASGVDSRTIIDSIGAEDLLGMGDMLYLTARVGKPVRVQGVYLDTEEAKRVTNQVKLTREPDYITNEITEKPHNDIDVPGLKAQTETTGKESDDELIAKALEVLRETRKASASLFQRRLSLGYARAARILDLLEERGYVGPSRGAKPREIYLDNDNNDQ